MRIYLHEGKALHGEASYSLIRLASEMYLEEEEINLDADIPEEYEDMVDDIFLRLYNGAEIALTEKGKPYFKDIPLQFSVTNCGDMWMCAISEKPCGIDLQIAKKAPFEKIAERFYRPMENDYVKALGEEGFFRIWVRREAYGKAIGEGFWGDIPELVSESVGSDLVLVDRVGDFNFYDIEVGEGIYCVVCTEDEAPSAIELI